MKTAGSFGIVVLSLIAGINVAEAQISPPPPPTLPTVKYINQTPKPGQKQGEVITSVEWANCTGAAFVRIEWWWNDGKTDTIFATTDVVNIGANGSYTKR